MCACTRVCMLQMHVGTEAKGNWIQLSPPTFTWVERRSPRPYGEHFTH